MTLEEYFDLLAGIGVRTGFGGLRVTYTHGLQRVDLSFSLS